MIECLATDAELVAEGVERAIPGLITAAMTASLSDDEVAALVELLLAQNYGVARRVRPSC